MLIVVFSSWQAAVSAIGALVLHEAAHFGVGCLFHEQMMQIDVTPFGGIIAYKPGHCPSKGIKGLCVAAAGPIGNYLALLLCMLPPVQQLAQQDHIQTFMMANLTIMCLNLLPVLPLDGGNMVLSVGYYVFPVARLIACLTLFGILTGIALMLLALYGCMAFGILNISLMMIGGYMLVCAVRNRETLLVQNLYTVIQERGSAPESIRLLRLYAVPADVCIQALLAPMERSSCAAFVFEDMQGTHIVSEKEICQFLLENPLQSLYQAWEEHRVKRNSP